ncbi:hypothetical protein R1538_34720 [Rhizobium leguminosarum]|uniref:hypothetical protein n=1 Tax=Rhizobium leguminosarum TaxID=384 RepID=UPI00293DF58F|nr:hypothetical protein [Rhizobium leguminosarum]MDV4166206.1 hypothetical protein [Rhizobium leguminosarum]
MGGKAIKIKQRGNKGAGRPRKQNVERYPSGDVKRSETQREAMSVAIEARRRIDGWGTKVTDETVKSPFAGYTLGRIFLDGKITEEQRKAGDEYAEIHARYRRLVGLPAPSARAQSLFSIKGHDGDENETITQKARKASNAMMEVEGVLLRCVDGPQIKQLIFNVSVMDYDHLRGVGEQQLLWIRRGLTALAKRKQLQGASKSDSWYIQQSELRTDRSVTS